MDFEGKAPLRRFQENSSTQATPCRLLLFFSVKSPVCWKSPKKLSQGTALPSIRSLQLLTGFSVMSSFPWQVRGGGELQELREQRQRGEEERWRQPPDVLLASSHWRGRVAGGIGRRRKKSLVRNTKLLLSRSMLKRKQKTSLLCCFYPRGSICHNISSRHILPILRDPSKTINSRVLGFQYMCSWGGAAKRSDIHLTPGPLFALFHPWRGVFWIAQVFSAEALWGALCTLQCSALYLHSQIRMNQIFLQMSLYLLNQLFQIEDKEKLFLTTRSHE